MRVGIRFQAWNQYGQSAPIQIQDLGGTIKPDDRVELWLKRPDGTQQMLTAIWGSDQPRPVKVAGGEPRGD